MRLVYYDEAVIERLAAAAELDETMTVADVGTGTGFVAAGLAGRVARVIGIDDSPGMLAEAERNLAELGATNVELHRGDIAALPLPDNSVDAAVANMVLHHATDPAAMLGEMARIVRPSGTVAICDEVTHPYTWMREEHHDERGLCSPRPTPHLRGRIGTMTLCTAPITASCTARWRRWSAPHAS
jgi:ArsR family transcriptional regulator